MAMTSRTLARAAGALPVLSFLSLVLSCGSSHPPTGATPPDADATSDAALPSDARDEDVREEQDQAAGEAADAAADAVATDSSVDGAACALPPPAADASVCNGAMLFGSAIASTCVATEPPSLTGGTIEDGVYVLEALVYYGTCPASPTMAQVTWYVCGSRWATAQGFGTLQQLEATVLASGDTLTAMLTCGGNATVTWHYSAFPGRLVLELGDASTGNVRIETYVRQ